MNPSFKFFLVLLLCTPFTVFGQDDDEWPSLEYLRGDFREVQLVAHINVEKAEVVGRIGGYENWKVKAKIIEVFKGKLTKGAEFEYLHGAEAGLKEELFLGEKIVFLYSEYDKAKKSQTYTVLENSTLAANEDRVRKLRKVRSSSRRRR